MDRRKALQLLAASGAGVTGSAIVTNSAFADGAGSTSCEGDAFKPIITSNGVNVGGPWGLGGIPVLWEIMIAAGGVSYYCPTGGTKSPAGNPNALEWRLSDLTGDIEISYTTPAGIQFGTWFVPPVNDIRLFCHASPGTATLRWDLRQTCCYTGKCANWRCTTSLLRFDFTLQESSTEPYVSPTGLLLCDDPPPNHC